jgi:hypothetical protein
VPTGVHAGHGPLITLAADPAAAGHDQAFVAREGLARVVADAGGAARILADPGWSVRGARGGVQA